MPWYAFMLMFQPKYSYVNGDGTVPAESSMVKRPRLLRLIMQVLVTRVFLISFLLYLFQLYNTGRRIWSSWKSRDRSCSSATFGRRIGFQISQKMAGGGAECQAVYQNIQSCRCCFNYACKCVKILFCLKWIFVLDIVIVLLCCKTMAHGSKTSHPMASA